MTARATITLDDKNFEFLGKVAAKNRSLFINQLLEKERQRQLQEAFAKANLEEAADEELHAERRLWDVTLMDGLADEPE